MDTNYNFSGFQIICQIVCKPENNFTAPPKYEYPASRVSFDLLLPDLPRKIEGDSARRVKYEF